MRTLSPQKRLRKRWEFARFRRKSQVTRLEECTIYRIPNQEGHFRVGITVRARCNSVVRNRIKRQIREAFRLNGDRLGSFDFNVVIPPSLNTAHPFSKKLRQTLEQYFRGYPK